MTKRCPLRVIEGSTADCLENECAWFMEDHVCAVPRLVGKLDLVARNIDSVDDTLLGYDQRGMLVRTTEA